VVSFCIEILLTVIFLLRNTIDNEDIRTCDSNVTLNSREKCKGNREYTSICISILFILSYFDFDKIEKVWTPCMQRVCNDSRHIDKYGQNTDEPQI
jgi:hypothetical protein